jgi:hypothetical protein
MDAAIALLVGIIVIWLAWEYLLPLLIDILRAFWKNRVLKTLLAVAVPLAAIGGFYLVFTRFLKMDNDEAGGFIFVLALAVLAILALRVKRSNGSP